MCWSLLCNRKSTMFIAFFKVLKQSVVILALGGVHDGLRSVLILFFNLLILSVVPIAGKPTT